MEHTPIHPLRGGRFAEFQTAAEDELCTALSQSLVRASGKEGLDETEYDSPITPSEGDGLSLRVTDHMIGGR
jgi:hypothetical protein